MMSINKKRIYDIVCMLIGTMLLLLSINQLGLIDNDYYFLAATGDEIIRQGKVPDINPFFLIEGKPIVIQQWLWCVICSAVSHYGNIGVFLIQLLQLTILEVLLIKLFMLKKPLYNHEKINEMRFPQIFMMSNISVWLGYGLMTSIRPEAITTILLLLQIYSTEKYILTKHRIWLSILPICTLLEINLHSSMWFMHFCVLIPYFLPFIDKKPRTKPRNFIIPMIFMVISLFINPVGIKAILFVFESFTMGTFKILKSSEMYSFLTGKLSYLLAVFLFIDSFIKCIKRKYFSGEEFYISCGIMILVIKTLKSAMFMPILCLYYLPYIFVTATPDVKVKKVKLFFEKHSIKCLSVVAAAVGILTAINLIDVCSSLYISGNKDDSKINTGDTVSKCEKIIDCIDKHKGKDSKILTHFNIGGYLEYKGYRKIYMDARPESYAFHGTSAFGDTSILDEYAKLDFNCGEVNSNFLYEIIGAEDNLNFEAYSDEQKQESLQKAIEENKTYTDNEIDKILQYYDFDYFIVDKSSRIYYYLSDKKEYDVIMTQKTNGGVNYALVGKS